MALLRTPRRPPALLLAALSGAAACVTALVLTAAPAAAAPADDAAAGARSAANESLGVFGDGLEQALGREAAWELVYSGADSWETITTSPDWYAGRDTSRLVYSVAMLPGDGSTLAAGARGDYDDHWRRFTERMLATGAGHSIVRLGWEATGPWYPWYAGSDPEAWKAYWRRIVGLTREAGASFRFDWNPNCEPFYPPATGGAETLAEAVYPGDDVVDFVGCDLYDAKWGDPGISPEARWDHQLNRRGGLKYLRDFAVAHGKPLTHPEWGLWNAGDQAGGGGDNPYFIREFHRWLEDNAVGYHVYFNFDNATDRHSLTSGEFPQAAAEFTRLFASGEGSGPQQLPADLRPEHSIEQDPQEPAERPKHDPVEDADPAVAPQEPGTVDEPPAPQSSDVPEGEPAGSNPDPGPAGPDGKADAPAPGQVFTAEAFVDSIGVATHLTYTDTAYGDWPAVRKVLVDSGIRHIRDGWGTGSPEAVARLGELRDLAGIKVTFVADPRSGATPAELHRMVRDDMAGLVEAVEGPNEMDLSGRPGWAQELRDWTAELSRLMRSDPATAAIPVIAPSLGTQGPQARAEVGDLGAWVDQGNLHDYPGGRMMSDGIVDRALADAAVVAPGRPVVATETGYSTAMGATDAHHPPVGEDQAGVLLPRMYLEHLRRGVTRTFAYELVDEHDDGRFESGFGLVRRDFSPKPAFTAVANTVKLLADPGPAFTPAGLDHRLHGADDATRSLVVAKADGSHWLAVWQQAEVWDPTAQSALDPLDLPVTLELGSPAGRVRTYRPSGGTDPTYSVAGTDSATFTSSEDVVLVEVVPGGTTADGAGAEASGAVDSVAAPSPDSSGSNPEHHRPDEGHVDGGRNPTDRDNPTESQAPDGARPGAGGQSPVGMPAASSPADPRPTTSWRRTSRPPVRAPRRCRLTRVRG